MQTSKNKRQHGGGRALWNPPGLCCLVEENAMLENVMEIYERGEELANTGLLVLRNRRSIDRRSQNHGAQSAGVNTLAQMGIKSVQGTLQLVNLR